MRIYLDTSAYLKGFNEEYRSDVVEDIFDKCEKGRLEIVTSLWTISEAIAALDQAFRKKGVISRPVRNSTISSLLGKTVDLGKCGKNVSINYDIHYLDFAISSSALLMSFMLTVRSLLWPWLDRVSLNSIIPMLAISAAFPRETSPCL